MSGVCFVEKSRDDSKKQINNNVHRTPYPQAFVDTLPASAITCNHPSSALAIPGNGEGVTRTEVDGVGKKRPIEHIEPNTDGKNSKLARRQTNNPDKLKADSECSQRYLAFEAKIRGLDKYAEIVDAKTIRHLKCGKELSMKYRFNLQNFKTHIRTCKGPPKTAKLPGGGMRSITHWFQPTGQQRGVPSIPIIPQRIEPCPGLDDQHYEQVAYYLDRTGAYGGGASSVNKLSQELYGKKFRLLSKKRKSQVKTAQMHQWLWKNDHSSGKVFSTTCLKTVSVQADISSDDVISPCKACLLLLSVKKFKNACSVEQKPYENHKFLNKEYTGVTRLVTLYAKSKQLVDIMDNFEVSIHCFVDFFSESFQDSRARPMLKYVNGLISGEYKEANLFADLIEAMYLKNDKKQRGKGLQNMCYSPNLVEFAHILLTHSPKAYVQLQEVLPLPTQRTLQYVPWV